MNRYSKAIDNNIVKSDLKSDRTCRPQANPDQLLKEWLQNPVEAEPTDSVKDHDLIF